MSVSNILALANVGALFAVVIYYLYTQRKAKESSRGETSIAADINQLRQERHDFFLTHGKDLDDLKGKLEDIYQQRHSANNHIRNLAEAIRTTDAQLRRDVVNAVINDLDKERR